MWEDLVLRGAAIVIAVGTAVGLLVKAAKEVWAIARRVARILELVENELQPNGGMSLKDQISQNSRALQELRDNQVAGESHTHLHELAQAERDVLVDAVLRSILDRLRALDGGSGGEQFDPPEGEPV